MHSVYPLLVLDKKLLAWSILACKLERVWRVRPSKFFGKAGEGNACK